MILKKEFSTPLGTMLAGINARGLCFLSFTDTLDREALAAIETESDYPKDQSLFDKLENQLNLYFSHRLKIFDLPLDMIGTPFQTKVWSELMTIPYGHTRTYSQQTLALGDIKAIRAVANANGKNNIAIVIPCHRIIGSGGKLTGYAGGLWRKQKLLELEAPSFTLVP
jgi:O-6-methylguanine DNA methyltransferase